MGTRGLIGIRKGKEVRYIYNNKDSYPSGLGFEIQKRLNNCKDNNDFKKFKKEILKGKFTEEKDFVAKKMLKSEEIDYLFHEYIYIIDFDKKIWDIYKTKLDKEEEKKFEIGLADEVNTKKGKLIPILKNIKFNDKLFFKTFENVLLIKEFEEKETYDIVFCSNNHYYLLDKEGKIIVSSKNKNDLVDKAIIKRI